MKMISREELKEKLDRGDNFKLVNVLGDWAFQAKHIPGSLNVHSREDARKMLDLEDEIVVHCSDETCIASQAAYHMLEAMGYKNVRRYAGGLADWEKAGYPLEGSAVVDQAAK